MVDDGKHADMRDAAKAANENNESWTEWFSVRHRRSRLRAAKPKIYSLWRQHRSETE